MECIAIQVIFFNHNGKFRSTNLFFSSDLTQRSKSLCYIRGYQFDYIDKIFSKHE